MSEKLTKTAVGKMNPVEIAGLLKELYGIEVDPDEAKKGDLVDQFMEAQEKALGDNDPDKTSGDKPAANTSGRKKKEKLRKILISEDDNGQDYVFVGINGRQFQIPRGKEVEVPESILGVLKDAIQERYSATRNATTGASEVHSKMVPRFGFQVLD